MAPEAEVLKRKRSRPSDWWAASPSQPTPPQQNEPPAKKRGRPSLGGGGRSIKEVLGAANHGKTLRSKGNVPSAEQRNDELVNALRRGRSSNTEAELQAAATRSVDQDEIGRTKRGRPSVTHREEDAVVGGSAKDQPAPTRRGRPRVSQVDELAELEIPVEDIESSKLLRRGRSSNTGAGVQAAVESSAKEYAGRKKRTRRSDAEIEVPVVDKFLPAENIGPKQHKQGKPHIKIATSSLAKDRSNQKNLAKPSKIVNTITVEGSSEAQEPTKSKKRGRPSNAGVLEGTGSATGQSKRTKSRRASDPEVQKRKHKEVEEAEDSHRPNRSRLHKDSQQEENETSHIASLPVYQHLAVVTRRVPRHTIEAKWEPLTQVCIERVSQLLEDIQKPVVVRLNDEHRRTQSSTALEMVSRRLVRKLSRGLPFPQGTRNHREDDFDFEKILDHSRAIESQLTPALHANELLEAEIRKETALLQSEKAALAELEANAKTEASKRREAGRKLHSLLQANDSTMEEDDLRDQIGLDIDHIPPSLTLNIQNNESLETIVWDLTGHVDSIQGNLNQIKGITEAIAKSRAAVQAALFSHLESRQYEEVALG